MNPIPEKSTEMKNKIQIFNEGTISKEKERVSCSDDQITSGKVSEIIATFSSSSPSAAQSCNIYNKQNVIIQAQK